MKVWVHINGLQEGPFELDTMPLDRMGPDTPVWYNGLPDWMPARLAPEVARFMADCGIDLNPSAEPVADEAKVPSEPEPMADEAKLPSESEPAADDAESKPMADDVKLPSEGEAAGQPSQAKPEQHGWHPGQPWPQRQGNPQQGCPQPRPGYQQPAPGGYKQPAPGYQQPGPGCQQPAPGYQQPAPGYQQPGPGCQQPAPGYQQPAPGYRQAGPQPGYQQPWRVPTGPDGHPLPCPPNYLVWSILLTVICCNPIGIVAIIYGSSVKSKFFTGDIEAARRASETTQWWLAVTIVTGLILSCCGMFII